MNDDATTPNVLCQCGHSVHNHGYSIVGCVVPGCKCGLSQGSVYRLHIARLEARVRELEARPARLDTRELP